VPRLGNVGCIHYTLLAFSNWPPRYLSEFLFGGPVAGPVIYYLFEILFVGQFADQLSNIFSNSWGQFAIGPVAEGQ
jgi:hypothetical protein